MKRSIYTISLCFLTLLFLSTIESEHIYALTEIPEGEFHALILFAITGMIVMAGANDLMVFFMGLETMSVAVYVLTGDECS